MVVSFQSLTADSGQGMAQVGYELSKNLHSKGLLDKFVIHSKGKYTTPFPSVPVSSLSRYYLFILNKLNNIFNFPTHHFRFTQELIYDWFCAKKLNSSVDILLSTQPYLKRTFKKAQKLNIKTYLITGTPEDNYIYNIVSEEKKRIGSTEIDAYTYNRRNKYFNQSIKYVDVVIGFFPTIYKTYKKSSAFTGETVNLTGFMKPNLPEVNLSDIAKENSETYSIGYLAYSAVLKGLQYLLEAWKQLQEENALPNAKLVIGGPNHPTVDAYIDKHYRQLKNVAYKGQVNDIPKFMQGFDLFVVPSLVDAGPMSALEATHYGIPVVITDNCGYSELYEKNESGYVIPIKDVAAIKEKILLAYNDRPDSTAKGLKAKQSLDSYSFENYISELTDFIEKRINE